MRLSTGILPCLTSFVFTGMAHAWGANLHEAQAACTQLSAQLSGKVAVDPDSPITSSDSPALQTLYNDTRASYWNTASGADRPRCMVFPACARDVADTIKVLQHFPTVPFNLKSGGHQWNYGFSSTNGGVLISFRPNLQDVAISHDHSTVDVGPGARWKEVMSELQKYDRLAVGGRADHVGVGGYVILGGLSYLTGEYGFASDNVVNFEAVLANGTIVNANKDCNADLYFALRGGGANYAVVTKYTLLAHPAGTVWGGSRIYTNDKAPKLIAAISNYLINFNTTVAKSALLPTIAWPAQLNGTDIWTVFMFWHGEQPPEHVFKDFMDIDAVADTTGPKTYPEILNLDGFTGFSGRTTDRVGPLASLPHDSMVDFLTWHYTQAKKAPFINNSKDEFVLFSMALQPIPVDLQKANAVGIPGALHVNPDGGDKMWIEYSLIWNNTSADAYLPAQLAALALEGEAYQKTHYAGVKPTKYRAGALPHVAYNPVFANDGQTGQPVFRSLGQSTVQRLEKARKEYDPFAFFQRRKRGFPLDAAFLDG